MKDWFHSISCGIGQVMLQGNTASGLLMLAGIVCASPLLALLALAGNAAGTLFAKWKGYPDVDWKNGIYGFNGTLVGIAIGAYMEINIFSLFLLCAGACFSAWLTKQFQRQHLLPGFTAPFIITVWVLLLASQLLFPSLLLPPAAPYATPSAEPFQAFFLNYGQVMFQGDMLAGFFFLLGILFNSRMNVLYASLGAAIPLLCYFFADDYAMLNTGLMGYNAVLCGIALGDKSWKGAGMAILSILLSTGLQLLGIRWGIATLTAPFVLATWMVLLAGKHMCKSSK